MAAFPRPPELDSPEKTENLPAVNFGARSLSDIRELARRATPRPTHYETLGLSPTASTDDITRAFVRKMGALTPRPVAELAQLSVAYETLRDPKRRRAYDESLRPAPMPEPRYAVQWKPAPAPKAASALVERLSRPVDPEPQVVQAERSALDSSGLRQARATPEPQSRPIRHDERIERAALGRSETNSIDWTSLAAALALPVLGVAVLGAVAGWAATIADVPEQSHPSRSIALPKAEPKLPISDASVLAPSTSQEGLGPRARIEEATSIKRSVRSVKPTTTASEEAGEKLDSAQSEAAVPEPTIETAAATEAVSTASMPLSNQTIARTIGRIGYSCGEVMSTAPVENEAAGVFKVTCSSGQSYQARPVGGRYHFRRWTRH
jgi:hypothetical protein